MTAGARGAWRCQNGFRWCPAALDTLIYRGLGAIQTHRPFANRQGFAIRRDTINPMRSMSWDRESPFDTPAGFEPPKQNIGRHPQLPRPSDRCLRSPLKGEHPVVPAVIVLLLRCSPTAVISRVWAVYVDPINAVIRRGTRPHVGKKPFKRLPVFRYRDSATSVILPCRAFGIVAPIVKVCPDLIQRGHLPFRAVTMANESQIGAREALRRLASLYRVHRALLLGSAGTSKESHPTLSLRLSKWLDGRRPDHRPGTELCPNSGRRILVHTILYHNAGASR